MHVSTSILLVAFVCGASSSPTPKRNLKLLDMVKTPLLMTYREEVPENQLYYLTQLHHIAPQSNFFRNDVSFQHLNQ